MSDALIAGCFGFIGTLITIFGSIIVMSIQQSKKSYPAALWIGVIGLLGTLGCAGGVFVSFLFIEKSTDPNTHNVPENPLVIVYATQAPQQQNSPNGQPPVSPTANVRTNPSPSSYLFEDGCINKNIWRLYQGNSAPENNNCWDLESKGVFAIQGTGLSINISNPQNSKTYGLITSITSDTDISFNMNINALTTVSDWNTNIAIGLIPNAISMPSQDGTSILFQSGERDEPIWMMLETPNAEQIYLPPPRISTNRVYNVKLEIRGTRLITYLDYEIADDRYLSENLPFFWIGYTVPQGGTLSATLTNFSLNSR